VVNASNVVILGNLLEGEVKNVVHGTVSSEVTLRLRDGGELVSVVTKPYAIGMGLGEGKKVYADIKASDVIIAVD
jgi:molybdopterin-binding protein